MRATGRRVRLSPGPDRPRSDEGSAVLLGLNLIASIAVAAVLVVDLGAYLVAAGRAQAAADAAALAAASVAHPRSVRTGDAQREARRVADASQARLDACRCRRGAREVEVTVSTPVRALVVTRLAGRRVSATARATLAPP